MTNRIETLPVELQDKIYEHVFKELYRDLIKEYNDQTCIIGDDWVWFDIFPEGDPVLVKIKGEPPLTHNFNPRKNFKSLKD